MRVEESGGVAFFFFDLESVLSRLAWCPSSRGYAVFPTDLNGRLGRYRRVIKNVFPRAQCPDAIYTGVRGKAFIAE